MITIENSTLNLILTQDSETTIIRKDNCRVLVFGDIVRLTDFEFNIYEFDYSTVSDPSEASAEALGETLNDYLNNSTVGADGTILISDSTQATGIKWVALSSEATIAVSGAITLSNAAVIAKVLTGYVSGAGTISATDSILQAIQKLNGNIAAGSSNSDYNNNFLLMGG